MVFLWKASVSNSVLRNSTVVLKSPLMESFLRAGTMLLRAISRVSPQAKQCPNCESAYSCSPPAADTLKYPHTFLLLWNVSSCTVPLPGLNPCEGVRSVKVWGV